MKPALALVLVALPVVAGEALHIAAVERKGWPPFADDRRVYRIEGEDVARLRVGEKLQLLRSSPAADPGRLKVARVEPGFAEAYLDQRGGTYPLRGDLAEPQRAQTLPAVPTLRIGEDLRVAAPASAPPPEAAQAQPPAALPPRAANPAPLDPHGAKPPRLQVTEAVYFLEGDGSLSPKGRDKVRRAVESWGADGSWRLGLPEDRTLPEKVRNARIQALRKALRSLGVQRLDLHDVERKAGDLADVVYLEKGE